MVSWRLHPEKPEQRLRSTGLNPTDEPGQTVTEKLSLGITTQITTKLKSDFQLTEVYIHFSLRNRVTFYETSHS